MRYLTLGFGLTLAACSGSPTAPVATSQSPGIRATVVFDGNSLLATEYGEPAWPDLVVSSLHDEALSVYNVGVGGQTTLDMLRDVEGQVDPLYHDGQRAVYVVWEVTNDLFFGASADSAYARIAQLGRDRKAQGWHVVVLTPMPRGNASDPGGWESRRQAVLDQMRQHWRDFADELVDIAADPDLGSYDRLDDKAWFRDRVHLGPEGTKRVGGMVAPVVIRQLFPRQALAVESATKPKPTTTLTPPYPR